MAGLRNITHLPHAEGKANIQQAVMSAGGPSGVEAWDRQRALSQALGNATVNFRDEYGHEPDWDLVSFRGCFTTFDALVEIWEEV